MCNIRDVTFKWEVKFTLITELSPIYALPDLTVTPVSPTGDSKASVNLRPSVAWDLFAHSSIPFSALEDMSSSFDAPRRALVERCLPEGKSTVILGA